jgi:hypothetical protein
LREPFVSRVSQAGLVFGKVTTQPPLVVRSDRAGGGVIFSGGIEAGCLAFNAGGIAAVSVADRKARLVVRG